MGVILDNAGHARLNGLWIKLTFLSLLGHRNVKLGDIRNIVGTGTSDDSGM
jgi:hypothetical protein